MTNDDSNSNSISSSSYDYIIDIKNHVYLSNIIAFNIRYKHMFLLLWVMTNLAVSAHRNHNWYNTTFGELYKGLDRRRLVPFVW